MAQRDESLTFIRFVAITLVVMVHVSAPAFVTPGASWHAGLVYDSAAHICVPLFFMVTGVLLLGKEHTVTSIIKRIRKVAVTLIVWSVIYLEWEQVYRGNATKDWLLTILTQPYMHLWFLYALISVYISLPVLSLFFRNATTSQKYWILGAWFVGASVLRLSDAMLGRPTVAIDLSLITTYGGYMLLGAVLFEIISDTKSGATFATAIVLWIIGTAAICYGSGYYMLTEGKFTMLFVDYWTPTVIISSGAAFVSLKMIFDRLQGAIWLKPFLDIGDRTFGIYLVHLIVLVFLLDRLPKTLAQLSPWALYPVVTAITVTICWILVLVVQRLPIARLLFPK